VDIEEDVDIDGADDAVYGEAQFTERDIIAGNSDEDIEVDIDDDEDDLRNLVAGPPKDQNRASQIVAIEDEVTRAGEVGDMQAMQIALGKRGSNIVRRSINFTFSPGD
jgi:hypothetical protein